MVLVVESIGTFESATMFACLYDVRVYINKSNAAEYLSHRSIISLLIFHHQMFSLRVRVCVCVSQRQNCVWMYTYAMCVCIFVNLSIAYRDSHNMTQICLEHQDR